MKRRRPRTEKPWRQRVNLENEARVDRLDRVAAALGLASGSETFRRLIDGAAKALGVYGAGELPDAFFVRRQG